MMLTNLQTETRQRAIAELQTHCPALDSQAVVDGLMAGLTQLRSLLMKRAHDDVERKYGADSMVCASLASLQRQVQTAKVEIEAYSCIVVDDEVSQGGYLEDADSWFLDWLFQLRMGSAYKSVFDKRVDYYRSQSIEERRLKFVSVLQRAIPDSAKAPLVLFRLFPRSVRILAAAAFGDSLRAQELRAEQTRFLPEISYCHECHGHVLDIDELCRCCGNPLWNFTWLLSQ